MEHTRPIASTNIVLAEITNQNRSTINAGQIQVQDAPVEPWKRNVVCSLEKVLPTPTHENMHQVSSLQLLKSINTPAFKRNTKRSKKFCSRWLNFDNHKNMPVVQLIKKATGLTPRKPPKPPVSVAQDNERGKILAPLPVAQLDSPIIQAPDKNESVELHSAVTLPVANTEASVADAPLLKPRLHSAASSTASEVDSSVYQTPAENERGDLRSAAPLPAANEDALVVQPSLESASPDPSVNADAPVAESPLLKPQLHSAATPTASEVDSSVYQTPAENERGDLRSAAPLPAANEDALVVQPSFESAFPETNADADASVAGAPLLKPQLDFAAPPTASEVDASVYQTPAENGRADVRSAAPLPGANESPLVVQPSFESAFPEPNANADAPVVQSPAKYERDELECTAPIPPNEVNDSMLQQIAPAESVNANIVRRSLTKPRITHVEVIRESPQINNQVKQISAKGIQLRKLTIPLVRIDHAKNSTNYEMAVDIVSKNTNKLSPVRALSSSSPSNGAGNSEKIIERALSPCPSTSSKSSDCYFDGFVQGNYAKKTAPVYEQFYTSSDDDNDEDNDVEPVVLPSISTESESSDIEGEIIPRGKRKRILPANDDSSEDELGTTSQRNTLASLTDNTVDAVGGDMMRKAEKSSNREFLQTEAIVNYLIKNAYEGHDTFYLDAILSHYSLETMTVFEMKRRIDNIKKMGNENREFLRQFTNDERNIDKVLQFQVNNDVLARRYRQLQAIADFIIKFGRDDGVGYYEDMKESHEILSDMTVDKLKKQARELRRRSRCFIAQFVSSKDDIDKIVYNQLRRNPPKRPRSNYEPKEIVNYDDGDFTTEEIQEIDNYMVKFGGYNIENHVKHMKISCPTLKDKSLAELQWIVKELTNNRDFSYHYKFVKKNDVKRIITKSQTRNAPPRPNDDDIVFDEDDDILDFQTPPVNSVPSVIRPSRCNLLCSPPRPNDNEIVLNEDNDVLPSHTQPDNYVPLASPKRKYSRIIRHDDDSSDG